LYRFETRTNYKKMANQIIRPTQLAKKLQVSKPTLWRMEKRGELPPKIRISGRACGWMSDDIENWLDSKKREEV
jgi:predicted DNA-binding transcriptional regulator AlpA